MRGKTPLHVCQQLDPPCLYRGLPVGDPVRCGACQGNVRIQLFACAMHGTCSTRKAVGRQQTCSKCADRVPPEGVDTPPAG